MLQRTLKVDHLQIPMEDRVILIIGKTGHGKSTLANHLVGDAGAFAVDEGIDRVTNECSAITRLVESNGRKYKLKVINTPVYFHGRHERSEKDQVGQIKKFLEKEAPHGVNTVLITLKPERITSSMMQMDNSGMKYDTTYDTTCFAVAFTGCEFISEKERQKATASFLKHPHFQNVASLIQDRYIAVCFPNLESSKESFKAAVQAEIAKEEERLRIFVTGEQFRDKTPIPVDALFPKRIWEYLPKFLHGFFY